MLNFSIYVNTNKSFKCLMNYLSLFYVVLPQWSGPFILILLFTPFFLSSWCFKPTPETENCTFKNGHKEMFINACIECEGWRRHSILIFLILLFTKPNIEVSGWLYQTKTHFTHIVYQPFSRVSPPSFTLYGSYRLKLMPTLILSFLNTNMYVYMYNQESNIQNEF